MSKPRPIIPGRIYLVTRRCRDRRFLLRPDEPTNQAFLYCLALAANRYNIGVVAFIASSNHWHGVLVDHDGRLPEFLHLFHAMLAKHQNVLRGRRENFWSSEQTSVVHLVNPEDVLNKVGYTLCNPVKDHLVERARHWPGASSIFAMDNGGSIKTKRPQKFFDKDGSLPETISLNLHTPAGFDNTRTFWHAVEELVAQIEETAAADRSARGLRVLGCKAILSQHWDDQPSSRHVHSEISPRLACRDMKSRTERQQEERDWQVAYRNARERWLAGEREVVFPAGTYWLRKYAGVLCANMY